MRHVTRALRTVYFLCAAALFLVVVTAPSSPSGYCYAGSGLLLAVAAGLPGRKAKRGTAAVGVSLAVGAASLRGVGAAEGRDLQLRWGEHPSARVLDRLVDEEDLAVNAARALDWTGFVRDPEVPGLADVMSHAYGRMRDAQGATPSPVLATYLGLQTPGVEDTIEIGDVGRTTRVVLFLHGYAGSFTLPCWVVSRAAADADFATVCPATRWVGDWWSTDGETTVLETTRALRRRGVRTIVLAGLSNGGIGASLLAPRLSGTLDGLVVVSGAASRAPPPGVPVLAIQGERDSMMSAAVVRGYADRVGGRYISLDAGHFALLTDEARVGAEITSFLRSRAREPSTARRTR